MLLDKFFLKLFGAIDDIIDWFTAPRCKCKRNKKRG